MDFEQAVNSRRTVRSFSPREIPPELVRAMIACAVRAPSSMNGQPWYFIIVRDRETKKRLAAVKDRFCPPEKREYPAAFMLQAPVILITCVNRAKSYDRAIENGVLATGHLLLAAANYGLTAVYMSAYKTDMPEVAEEIRAILRIPSEVDPITLLPMGYPAQEPGPKTLTSPDEVIFHEAFDRK